MAAPTLPVCNALWVGAALGPIEAACLSSFVEAGHPVDLHVYDEPSGVPAEVNVVDAALTLPRDQLIRHRATGSVSLASNRFRYALMAAGAGLWIDCDVLCLRSVADAPCIFGREDERNVNGAVLKLPADHPMLGDLTRAFVEPRWIPPWASRRQRLRYGLRYLVQPGFGIADMSWGSAGPKALTWYLRQHGLAGLASPKEVFYPVGPHETALLTGSDVAPLRARLTPQTACIHLWNKSLSQAEPAVPGSFLSRIADGSWRSAIGHPAGSA